MGPNGSGKSNVIDSLLFVFGRRANQIRLKKLSELIHKSSNFPDLPECRVSVHFHEIVDLEGDDYRVVPDSEFVIARSANQQSLSKYYVNGRVAQASEVTSILKQKGVDLDNNRFLILQGEVEQISLMKPKASTPNETGLLEYLEDIFGTNKYQKPIETSAARLEELNEKRQEKLHRLQLVQREMDGLEGAKQEAEGFILKEAELHILQGKLHQKYIADCERNIGKLEERQAVIEEKLNHENQKLETQTAELTAREEDLTSQRNGYNKMVRQMEKTKEEFNAFQRQDIKLQEDKKNEKTKIKKTKDALKRGVKTISDLETKLEADQQNLPQLKERLTALEAEKVKEEAVLDEYFEELRTKTEPIRAELEVKQKELMPHQTAINEVQQKIDVANSELSLFIEKTASAATKHSQAQKDLAEREKELERRQAELANSGNAVEKSRQRLPIAEKELADVTAREADANRQRQNLRSKTDGAKASLAAAKSRGVVMQTLMSAKSRGISGIHGRLGDLGVIDDKYDVAISTACSHLNSVVVDTTATGQKAVEFLRKRKAGRARFILMDKMDSAAAAMKRRVETPQGVPRLFDLVEVRDEKFLPAFYYALQDTLVADNIDQAVKIAYGNNKRWRVVTLQGQLIDTSGTMSGGGNRVARGGMSSGFASEDVVDEKEVEVMEQDLSSLEREVNELRVEKKRLEEEVKQLKMIISKAEINFQKSQMDIQNLEQTIEELQERVVTLEASLSLTEEEEEAQEARKQEVISLEKEVRSIRKETASLEREIAHLEKKIMDAGGAKLRLQKSKVEGLQKQVDINQKDITKMEVGLKTAEGKIEKTKKTVDEKKNELEECEAKYQEICAEIDQMTDEAAKVMAAYEEAQGVLKERAKELKALEKEYEKIEKETAAVRNVQVDLQNQMDDFTRVVKDNQKKLKHWDDEYEKVCEKLKGHVSIIEEMNEQATNALEQLLEDREIQDEDDKKDVEEMKRRHEAKLITVPVMPSLSPTDLEDLDVEDVKYQITMLKETIDQLKPNTDSISEYYTKQKTFAGRVKELDEITEERDTERTAYEELRRRRLDEFMEAFTKVTLKLKEMYQMLTLGGDAELELVDSLDPFSEGIVFSVRPPKKSWKNIQNLSGGEKTLSSLSLVFALHHYKPTPLYVMDEIDAALDFKNVSIVANYIKERTKNAQFIIISLRNNMFELADRLVGIYKTHDVTKSITIDPSRFTVPGASNEENVGAENAESEIHTDRQTLAPL